MAQPSTGPIANCRRWKQSGGRPAGLSPARVSGAGRVASSPSAFARTKGNDNKKKKDDDEKKNDDKKKNKKKS